MDNNKTSGNDGLAKEFYLAFFNLLGTDLQKCLNACFDKSSLTTSQKQAVITLIEQGLQA